MKKKENILQGGRGSPRKFWCKKTHLEHFSIFWSIIINNDYRTKKKKKKRKSVKKLKTLMPEKLSWRNCKCPVDLWQPGQIVLKKFHPSKNPEIVYTFLSFLQAGKLALGCSPMWVEICLGEWKTGLGDESGILDTGRLYMYRYIRDYPGRASTNKF